MRLISKIALLVGAASALCAFAPLQDRNVHTDSIGAHLTESTHVFHCETLRATLRFAEHLRAGDEAVDLADRWRIALSSISVSGRAIRSQDLRRLRARFHSFSWVERVSVRCTRYNRAVYFTVIGMEAETWAAFGEGRVRERPRPSSFAFTVAEDGSIIFS